MPAPTTVAELLDLVQKSGVVETPRLTAYADQLRGRNALPGEPNQLAAALVRDGLVTRFQAEQILQGKWKRFMIGNYKVLERLGAGGMGQVYLGEHRIMRRKVAVKVLPSAKAEDPSSLERFHREARAVAALDHPNLVRAFDIGQDGDLHYLVMEYVDGASLQEIVKRSGPLDPTRACHYVYYTAVALQYAYEVAELVHRDVKPGNIMVDRQGVVKLLDMGLARFFNDETDILTRKYDENVLGTADYLSPEQATDSHEVDIRADIYSLGATFYFMLTGHPPFPDGSVPQKLIWHQTRMPKPVRLVRPAVPEGISAIIERMMLKDPAARYQTPAELAGALARYVQTPIRPPSEAELPRLSPAAADRASGAAVRWTMPAARLSGTATATPPPAPAVAATARTPETLQAGPPPAAPITPRPLTASPRRDQVNPFAHLLGGGTPAGGWPPLESQNVYATAAARAANAALPTAPPPAAKSHRLLWAVLGALAIGAIAGGVFAVWKLTIGQPLGW